MLGVSFTPGQGFMLRKSWATQKRFQGSFVEGGAFLFGVSLFVFVLRKKEKMKLSP